MYLYVYYCHIWCFYLDLLFPEDRVCVKILAQIKQSSNEKSEITHNNNNNYVSLFDQFIDIVFPFSVSVEIAASNRVDFVCITGSFLCSLYTFSFQYSFRSIEPKWNAKCIENSGQ